MPFLRLFRILRIRGKQTVEEPKKAEIQSKANKLNKQKLFYPDYILSIHNEIWIIETKGGITYSGADANIDDFSEKKFNALKEYVAKYNLKGGFVVLDEDGLDDELYISTSMFHRIKDDRSEYTLLEDYFD